VEAEVRESNPLFSTSLAVSSSTNEEFSMGKFVSTSSYTSIILLNSNMDFAECVYER